MVEVFTVAAGGYHMVLCCGGRCPQIHDAIMRFYSQVDRIRFFILNYLHRQPLCRNAVLAPPVPCRPIRSFRLNDFFTAQAWRGHLKVTCLRPMPVFWVFTLESNRFAGGCWTAWTSFSFREGVIIQRQPVEQVPPSLVTVFSQSQIAKSSLFPLRNNCCSAG